MTSWMVVSLARHSHLCYSIGSLLAGRVLLDASLDLRVADLQGGQDKVRVPRKLLVFLLIHRHYVASPYLPSSLTPWLLGGISCIRLRLARDCRGARVKGSPTSSMCCKTIYTYFSSRTFLASTNAPELACLVASWVERSKRHPARPAGSSPPKPHPLDTELVARRGLTRIYTWVLNQTTSHSLGRAVPRRLLVAADGSVAHRRHRARLVVHPRSARRVDERLLFAPELAGDLLLGADPTTACTPKVATAPSLDLVALCDVQRVWRRRREKCGGGGNEQGRRDQRRLKGA